MRQAESARQHWLNGVRADYEAEGGGMLNCKYWGDTTAKARAILLEALLGSGLIDQSQKMTVAARATAEKKAFGHRS